MGCQLFFTSPHLAGQLHTVQLLILANMKHRTLTCSTPLWSISGRRDSFHGPVNAKMSAKTFPVLYNDRYGGFGFSAKALEEYKNRLPEGSKQLDPHYNERFSEDLIPRHDPLMV
jgi:hypothetical protein